MKKQNGTLGTPTDQDRNSKQRSWSITWNNPPDDWSTTFEKMEHLFKYIAQEETGEKNGTKHIQAGIRSNNPRSFKSITKLFPGCHIEPCHNWPALLNYCRKGKTRTGKQISNMEKPNNIKDPLNELELYYYQKDILEIIKEEPDDRTIHWYYEEDGKTGKTSLCKHICINNPDAVFLSGKSSDMKYIIAMRAENKLKTRIVLFNITRTQEQFISYEGIESIKDGIFCSTKYEGKMIIMDSPHIFIFANFKPNLATLSNDRWHIVKIIINEYP